jgi:SAM-dependent methyltransferase
MQKVPLTEYPDLELQKEYWKFWNSSYAGRAQDMLRPLRRGQKILGCLRSIHLERPTILDMGCGSGWFASQLAEFGPTTGVDLSDDAIGKAKLQYPGVTFMAGNVLDMELPQQHFDVVVSQEVIAHVPDQPGYLTRAAGVLKTGGHLIITTPNRFVHARSEWGPSPPGHIEQWLSRKALKRLLQAHFRVLRTTTVVPMGHRGILRLLNSTKLNLAASLVFSAERIEAFKERAGFGWTQVVLARKQS